MKRKLYDAIKNYCEENGCWKMRNTAKEWNEILGTTYSPATFTAAANSGLLERTKRYKGTSYEYRLIPTEEMKKVEEEAKRAREIEDAKRIIEYHEENVAKVRERYEQMIKQAEEQLERDLAFREERLAEAKALLNII